MRDTTFERELHKGSAEMLILSLLEDGQRHGYDIAKIIGQRSEGHLSFHIASLYATLYRLERRGLIQGRWVEKPDVRRRRYYRITPAGRKVLAAQRSRWEQFIAALTRIARLRSA
ncbi:MAG TPA: PadR family transcriptional regulator [Haliangiales bacterium]|nr:PadR family transcriptional regulator [Haliangiales bacterium]